MIFSVNSSIVYYNSGIEHAELKRTQLFHHYHEPTKILLDNWDVNNHYYTHQIHLSDNDFINMYDYYQHACHVSPRLLHLNELKIVKNSHSIIKNGNRCNIVYLGSYLFSIYYFWQTGHSNCIRKVECFHNNNCYRVDYYDIRGFLTRQMYFKPGSKYETKERFLTPTGKTAILKTLFKRNNHYYSRYYIWGSKCSLVGRNHLILHFLNLMCLKYGAPNHPVIFISDRWWRNRTVNNILDDIKYPHYMAFYTHYSHVSDAKKFMTGRLDARFHHIVNQARYGVSLDHSYDSLIFSTSRQGSDFQRRCHIPRKIFTIPVGIQNMSGVKHPLPLNRRRPWQITCMTRISPAEGILDTLKAFCLAHQQLPELRLDIYGKMGAYHKKFSDQLSKLRKKYHIDNNVMSLHKYTYHVPQLYRESRLTLSTGPSDAFNISLLEALSQGCPAIVYDDNYGPRDMIRDGFNGYKVHNDYKAMSQQIVNLFNHPKLMQQMSNHAYQIASQQYSPAKIWSQWKKLIKSARNSWPDKLL